RSPSTCGSPVSVTDLRIVDRGVFGPTGGCVRYADVICNPPKLCWIKKVGDIHGTLSLGSDGSLLACQRWPGQSPPLLKPQVYYRELSPAG
ncbi:hypothetical protein KUCAC02_024632, partial [Chaenocephalus aceratus]